MMKFPKKPPKERGSDPAKTWVRKLDEAFSAYIRTRDTTLVGAVRLGRCITCTRLKPYAELDCGHFIGRQYWATRWDPTNCAAQCRKCNRFEEGLKDLFRVALLAKWGSPIIERMEAGHKLGRKPRIYEFQMISDRIKSLGELLKPEPKKKAAKKIFKKPVDKGLIFDTLRDTEIKEPK
jgi:hypothetical protein